MFRWVLSSVLSLGLLVGGAAPQSANASPDKGKTGSGKFEAGKKGKKGKGKKGKRGKGKRGGKGKKGGKGRSKKAGV